MSPIMFFQRRPTTTVVVALLGDLEGLHPSKKGLLSGVCDPQTPALQIQKHNYNGSTRAFSETLPGEERRAMAWGQYRSSAPPEVVRDGFCFAQKPFGKLLLPQRGSSPSQNPPLCEWEGRGGLGPPQNPPLCEWEGRGGLGPPQNPPLCDWERWGGFAPPQNPPLCDWERWGGFAPPQNPPLCD
jgi:hypothetical protein